MREDSTLMTEEIFGPVLPVLTVASCDEAISFVNANSTFGVELRFNVFSSFLVHCSF